MRRRNGRADFRVRPSSDAEPDGARLARRCRPAAGGAARLQVMPTPSAGTRSAARNHRPRAAAPSSGDASCGVLPLRLAGVRPARLVPELGGAYVEGHIQLLIQLYHSISYPNSLIYPP